MDPWALLTLGAGLVLLVGGAEALVRGASRLAAAFGVSPVVVGLTVVAYGTSAPELAVSAFAGVSGKPELALGNVVGSNVFNVLLILGAASLIGRLVVAQRIVRLDAPLVAGVSVAVVLLAAGGTIGRVEGAALLGAGVVYTAWLLRASRRESRAVRAEYAEAFGTADRRPAIDAVWVVAGLALLVGGSRLVVDGAVGAATALGVSQVVIGLTVVAAGTSLPELATSLLAAMRGERDIAVGNVIGSNLFNLTAVLGTSAALAPGGLPVPGAVLAVDLPVMAAASLACLPVFFTGHRIDRWEGLVLLAGYAAYVAYLVLDATGSVHERTLAGGALVVVPLLGATLLALALREWHRRRPPPDGRAGRSRALLPWTGDRLGEEVVGVLRWAAVNARRTGVLLLGVLLCVAGAALLVLPGPGLLVLVAGLAVLSIEFAWARRLLLRARAELRRRAGRSGEPDPPDDRGTPPQAGA